MKKRRNHLVLFLVIFCMLILFGCTRTRIIDKISIVHVFGFDQADNGDLIGAALVPNYSKSKSGEDIQYLEEQAETGVLFIPKLSKHTSTPVEMAKIRVLVFGKKYAEAGIQDMVDRFILNPQIGTHIQIAVSTHSARETLNTFKNEKSLTLYERIEQNIQGQALPKMNLHFFLNKFYGEGMDAFVPMITIDDSERLQIEGIGIFKGDKLKLHLNPVQTILFSFIEDKRTQATYKISLDENHPSENITVRAFRSNSNWDWDARQKKVNLHLDLQMTLTQYPSRFIISNPEDVMEIKKIIKKDLEKGIDDLLSTFKENEVDPLGIGNIVRSKDRTWEKNSFYEQYPTLPIHVNVNITIIHSGLEG